MSSSRNLYLLHCIMVVIVFVREFVLECVGSPEPVAHPVPVEAAVAAALAVSVADAVVETRKNLHTHYLSDSHGYY